MSAQPPAPAPAANASNGRRKVVMTAMVVVFLLIAIGVAAYHFLIGRFEEDTDNAYVGGNLIQVTPQAAGTVTGLFADDTQRVDQGQLLVQMDDADADVALRQAEAALAEAVRSVRGLFIGRTQAETVIAQRRTELARAQAEVGRAQSEVARTQADYKRRLSLGAGLAISAEEVAHAKEAYDSARSNLAANIASRDSAQAVIDTAKQQLAAAQAPVEQLDIEDHPKVLQAAANLKAAYLELARMRVVAPASGYVVKRSVQVGQRLAPGTPLLSVVPLDQVWVDANFKETQLSNLRIGQPVKLTADAYDGLSYDGVVSGIGVGSGSVLSLLPAQNATGNWIKIVQRVPVRITLKPEQLREHPLRVGLSMIVTVDTHDTRGALLPAKAVDKPVQVTDVYAEQARAADAEIHKIIEQNRG